MQTEQIKTQVLIIGGGATGAGLARELALRGVDCVLIEKGDFCAGASGANHGLLHSGARYVGSSPEAARECRRESRLLKRLAPHCIENTGGLFVAVEGDDENYIAEFPDLCARCGIKAQKLDIAAARELEPALSDRLIAAYKVEDATVDPFRLVLENISQAQDKGARMLPYCRLTAFDCSRGHIRSARLTDRRTGKSISIEAEQVVNAAGAWAAEIAALAGVAIPMLYSKGTLLVTHQRMSRRVINRLRPAADGDILVPGQTVSLFGTTSVHLDDLTRIRPTIREVDQLVGDGRAMVPQLEKTRFIRAYAGVRPLLGTKSGRDDRSVSRGFNLLTHEQEGMKNFTTITGGKLTTYRLMAERTADLVATRLGIPAAAPTSTTALQASQTEHGSEGGLSPRLWLQQNDPQDLLLCECEMVPRSAIDNIIANIRSRHGSPDLKGVALRSRVGKGPCQGAFCGLRIIAHMYDRGDLRGERGIADLKNFLGGRWRGVRPVLWGAALIQEELQEALHCGMLGLELQADEESLP